MTEWSIQCEDIFHGWFEGSVSWDIPVSRRTENHLGVRTDYGAFAWHVARMCFNVDASSCRGLRVEHMAFHGCSLACRQQETCIACFRLTSKEIVSLSVRLLVLKVTHSNRTEVLLIVFVTFT